MDPVVASVLGLAAIAAAAISGAFYYGSKLEQLRKVSTAAYHLASNLLDPDEQLTGYEKDAGEALLLEVLANPDGPEAKELTRATSLPPFQPYSTITKRAQAHSW